MKKILSVVLALLLLMTYIPLGAVSVSAADYEYAYFPGSVLKVTQGAYGEFNSYSHNGQGGYYQNAFDLGGNSNYCAPFSGTITSIKTSYNAVVLQSDNMVYWANGTLDYMSVTFVHDNDISDLYVGKHIAQGEVFYQPGIKDPGGYTTGTHLHLCVNRGKTTEGIRYFSGDTRPNEALFLKDSVTVQQTGNYTWKKTSTPSPSVTLPGKPSFSDLDSAYLDSENIVFKWDKTKNTTHYNIWIDVKNEQGEWVKYEHIRYVESGITMKLPVGEYRCELQAYNSEYYWEDGSDWQHSLSDFYYFSVYDLENHTCKGEVMCYVDAHPHYACYKCSICDAVWNNDSETSVVETCLECTLPEKPSFINLKHLYLENENVTFMWDETKNTTHYNIWIDIKNERGEWTRYEHITYVESGVTMKLPLGEYRCELQAYNSGYYWEDGSDWQHTLSDFCYFSVGCNHIYTGSCDASCNICGAIRAIVHTWVDATYDAPKTCITCGATEGEALERGNYSPDVTHSVMDTKSGNGLAFRFELTANGVVKDNRNVVDLASATINYLGTDCKLIGMGAIVTNSDAAAADLTLDAVNDFNVVNVPTVYLQDADEDSCAFATRITNIPDNQLERTIYARPYYIVEVDGQQIIVYGDVDAACCAESM